MSLVSRFQEGICTPSDEFLILFLVIGIPIVVGCIVWILMMFFDEMKVGFGVAIMLGLCLVSGFIYFIYESINF